MLLSEHYSLSDSVAVSLYTVCSKLDLPDLLFFYSHVHAAYASFLWETEEDADDCAATSDIDSMPPQFHEGTLANA